MYNYVLCISPLQSGGMSAIPYILPLFCSLGIGYLSDVLIRHRILRTITVRKLNTAVGAIVPAALLILVGYVGCDFQAAEAFFTLAVAFSGFSGKPLAVDNWGETFYHTYLYTLTTYMHHCSTGDTGIVGLLHCWLSSTTWIQAYCK